MSALSAVFSNLKKVLLLENKVDRLEAEVQHLSRKVEDHESRLVRIETMIEVAGGGRSDHLRLR